MKKSIILIFVILLLLVFAVFYISAHTSMTPETTNGSINSSENISIGNETGAKLNNSTGGGVSIPLKKPPFID